ncbi:MAG: MltA domain-containing protein [Rhodospirillaceae bacterium]|nr:MltA domain-containing protein [Rhodospirillaceae bacterium]
MAPRLGGVAVLLAVLLTLAACDNSGGSGRPAAPVSGAAPAASPPRGLPAQPDTVPPELALSPVRFVELPGWTADDAQDAAPALLAACRRIAAQPPDTPIGPGGLGGAARDWLGPCREAELLGRGNAAAVRGFLQKWFRPYAVSNGGHAEGVFTGYYEAELRGARRRDARYTTPIYRPPPDLVSADLGAFRPELAGQVVVGRLVDGRLVPYFTRAEIDDGALAGRGLELLWVDDPVDAFFLHIQGSGRVVMADGSVVRLGFAASNGHPFFGIARTLIDTGELAPDDASMPAVRDWLHSHPRDARALMERNRRYIFFQEIDGPGPVGALGVPLTPARSVAVDPAYIPLGAPLWLDTTWPAGSPQAGRPLRRLMVAQDVGSAIKGAVRADIYWGSGEAALAIAGGMKQKGRYYLLLPRTVSAARRPAG